MQQARDKIREAAWLLKRRGRRVGAAAAQALEDQAEEVARLLGRVRAEDVTASELSESMEALETVLETQFGQYRK
ncbi:MAG: hypothetical protein VYE15_06250, partial [Myxococcota bacterium]|nr:hypothetical protein [Myxococcota bacterium]